MCLLLRNAGVGGWSEHKHEVSDEGELGDEIEVAADADWEEVGA